MKTKLLGTLALGVAIGAVVAAGPLEASSKQTIPRACIDALTSADTALQAAGQVLGDYDTPDLRLALYIQLVQAVRAGDENGFNVAVGGINQKSVDFSVAEGDYYDSLARCRKKAKL